VQVTNQQPKLVRRFSLILSFPRDWEDTALQECNRSVQSSVDCESIPIPIRITLGSGSFLLLRDAPPQAMAKAKNSSISLGRQAALLTKLDTR